MIDKSTATPTTGNPMTPIYRWGESLLAWMRARRDFRKASGQPTSLEEQQISFLEAALDTLGDVWQIRGK